MSKLNMIKKIIFWILAAIFMALLILSIVNSVKPEAFEGFLAWSGIDPVVFQTLMTTFGWGGTIGTVGFSVIQTQFVKSISSTTRINEQTVELISNKVGEVVGGNNDTYKGLVKEQKTTNENIGLLMQHDKEQSESYEALATQVKLLIELETLNLNKTLANPLVTEESKDLIRAKMTELGILPKEEVQE